MLDSVLNIHNTNGSDKWRNKSLYKIRKVHLQADQIENSRWNSANLNGTVANKEICANLSNYEALKHGRAVRDVVSWLQETIVLSNEEIKKLTLIQKNYDKFLYNIVVDEKINEESRGIRQRRPDTEKKLSDGTDDLLAAERVQLRQIGRHVRVILRTVQEHLVGLNQARSQLLRVQKERTRVLDLLCQRTVTVDDRVSTRGSLRSSIFRSTDCSQNAETDPLSSYTPACKDAIQTAKNMCQDSQTFREQIDGKLENIQQFRNKSSRLVDNSFIHKLTETGHLKGQLQLARVRARSATNKAKRWHNYAERTMEFNRGPQKYDDLMVRERLDRPVIKVFQRHPGTQLPEAQELIKVDNRLRSSVLESTGNIDQMKHIDADLYEDIKSKSQAMYIDRQALRLRRCRLKEMHCK